MNTFLTFIGLLALYIIGKFIYETFLTDTTEKNLEEFEKNNPEIAARIKRNKGLNLNVSPKQNPIDKRDSLLRLAENLGCTPGKAKEEYIKKFREKGLSGKEVKIAITLLREKKHEESLVFDIDPDDTAAAIMEKWTTEFFNKKEYKNRKRTEQEAFQDLLIEYPDLENIFMSGDMDKVDQYLDDNPAFAELMIEESAYAGEPAEKFRQKAIREIYDNSDYLKAIELINGGLEIDEPQTEPYLFYLRAECEEKLLNYDKALTDWNNAIQSIHKNSPDDNYSISDFLKGRGKLKEKIGDFKGAEQDKKISEEYRIKYQSQLEQGCFDEEEEDLPF